MPFSHENLHVYRHALAFNKLVLGWISQWDRKHAICDQLERAACSIMENIAVACGAFSATKIRSLEYAAGSTLECAACLDLAGIKDLLDRPSVTTGKSELLRVMNMLVGLRRAWRKETSGVSEGTVAYGGETQSAFHHERLDLYQVALAAAHDLHSSLAFRNLVAPSYRRLDELLTSVVLNIAEGNGRFSDAERRRFLGMSNESTVKLAARMDLCCAQGLLPPNDVQACKTRLERVAAMICAILREDSE